MEHLWAALYPRFLFAGEISESKVTLTNPTPAPIVVSLSNDDELLLARSVSLRKKREALEEEFQTSLESAYSVQILQP